jgi:stage II sporulation protein P
MRPLYMVDSRYNQHLTHGSLLIEVGSEANTVSEAVYSGEILGKTLAQVLNSLKK